MADEVKTYEVKLERRDICPFCNQSLKENQRLRSQNKELLESCRVLMEVIDEGCDLGAYDRVTIEKIIKAALDGE